MPRATRCARCTSRVHTPAARPNGVSFASASASSSEEKRSAASTGPKTSSRAMPMVFSTSPKIVGSTKKPSRSAGAFARAARHEPSALVGRGGDVALDVREVLAERDRTHLGRLLQGVAEADRPGAVGEALQDVVVNLVL